MYSLFCRLCSLKQVPFQPLVLIISVAICFMMYLWIGGIWDKQPKKVPDPAHRHNVKDSLIWAVNIENNNIKNKDDVDKIAGDLDLVNLGQVGELHNHYLFAHKLHANFSGNKTVSTVHNHHSEHHSSEDFQRKIGEIEEKLEKHDDINWYSHQKVLSRGKRSLDFDLQYMDFEDPYYRKQWHLVSCTFK